MGLDMYLSARCYTSTHFEPEIYAQLQAIKVPFQTVPDSLTIEGGVAYWRKCNAIHGWFVREVQDGKDDCAYYYVSAEKLTELRDTCVEVLEKRDTDFTLDKLPPTSGFFFGGGDVDDGFYEHEVKYTIDQLNVILNHPAAHKFEYQYHSSW